MSIFANRWARWLTIILFGGIGVFLTACASTPQAATPCPEVTCPECPEPLVEEVPYATLWAASPHADAESESFIHWNEEIPMEVPIGCAKCHSTPGYLDFVGTDGTEAGVVDNPAKVGTTITCVACHNEAAAAMDSVILPSGVEITGLGGEARCMQCHQGRAFTSLVDEAIAEAGLPDDDTVGREVNFVNVHYYAAAAIQYGGLAMGGYQYEDRTYDARSAHVEGYDTCISCHDAHSLEIKVASCIECHTEVTGREDLKGIRSLGSTVDYDGDGDMVEGIAYEIKGLQEILYQAIQAYARTPIAYYETVYPYFFIDTNMDGEADEDEATYPNKYDAWTGRLLKAAYNYQASVKDPGAFAHGPKYVIQLLYDAIEALDTKVAGLQRIDAGHFAGSQEAFRHWDEDGRVEAACARCHSATGLPTFLREGTNISAPLSNGLLCSTCHDDVIAFSSYYTVTEVTFPSGAVLDTGDPGSNLCMICHQGRQSTASVERMISGLGADTVYDDLAFHSVNIHYYAAGATLFGAQARGAYEYEGRTYNGRFVREQGPNNCIECHDTHSLQVDIETCRECHAGVEEPQAIRKDTTDYDGDGDTTEGIAREIDTLHRALYAAIQDYAIEEAGTPIVYDAHVYPYFFVDSDGSGQAEAGEAVFANQYSAWTPRMIRAAYNYQYVAKDPGAYVHNAKYTLQILYDSLADVGGDVRGMSRPEATNGQ